MAEELKDRLKKLKCRLELDIKAVFKYLKGCHTEEGVYCCEGEKLRKKSEHYQGTILNLLYIGIIYYK